MNTTEKIKAYMRERNWSEYRLAKEAGLSQSTVRNLFKRNNLPSIQTLEAICEAFHITLSQFFSDGNEAVELTERQHMLLAKWNRLSSEQQKILIELIDTIR